MPRAAGAVAAAKAKRIRLKRKSLEVAAGETKTVRLRFNKNRKTVKKIERLLKRGTKKTRRRARVVVKAKAAAPEGIDAVTRKVKLRR